ncbi:MAG: DUF975 family protein [Clostridiales bacterium]|nr:DUF975 family protein [Clostridiales bacterium]
MAKAKLKPTGVRKEWKAAGRKTVKKHYFLLVILCLLAIYFAGEFGFVQSQAEDLYAFVTGQEITPGGQQLKINNEKTHEKVLQDIIDDNIAAGRTESAEQLKEYQEAELTNEIQGRQSGIFAMIANTLSSGQHYLKLFNALHSVFHSSSAVAFIFLIGDLLVALAVWIFLKNLYRGILSRMVLEMRLYDSVPIGHALHFKLVHRWVRASLTLSLQAVYQMLWDLTIIGGIIKHYSYAMVPYIVAENPDIKPREAIRLSRRMMDGYKWEMFKLEFSFFWWYILSALTFGFVGFLWLMPYATATEAEYYTARRRMAKEEGIEGTEGLNDTYLFEYDEESHLRKVYADIEEQKKFIDENRVELYGARRFFAKNFGLWTGTAEEKKQYDAVDNVRQQIAEDRAVIKQKIYPQRLNPRWDDKNNQIVRNTRYLKTYTIWSVILVFFVFGFVGWSYEVGIHLVQDGVFVNRGALHGPWLPIYGGGVAMILVLLARFRPKPHIEALAIIILCGVVEFTTSYVMEMASGVRYWDYTGYFLNLNGRICGEGLMVFALGGCAAVYFIVPILDAMWSRVNTRILAPVCIVLLLAFAGDLVYSHFVPNTGEGITDYDSYKQVGSRPAVHLCADQPSVVFTDSGTGVQPDGIMV